MESEEIEEDPEGDYFTLGQAVDDEVYEENFSSPAQSFSWRRTVQANNLSLDNYGVLSRCNACKFQYFYIERCGMFYVKQMWYSTIPL